MCTENSARWFLRLGAAFVALLSCVPAQADITATNALKIGSGWGTPCVAGGCFLYGNEVNNLGTGTTVDIYNNSGSKTINDPVLLILAIPNNQINYFVDNNNNPPTPLPIGQVIGDVSYYDSVSDTTAVHGTAAYASSNQDNLPSPVSPAADNPGFFGAMYNSDVYSFLGLPGNNSNSFTNFALADAESSINGITATSFGIYAFAINGSALASKGLVNITFNTALPTGTFVIAYGLNCTSYNKGTCTSGTAFTNAFTQAGLTTKNKIPEPNIIILLTTALLMLGWASRRAKGRRILIRC